MHQGDTEVASLDFADICQETESAPYFVAGYILNKAFSMDQANWGRLCSFIIDHLHKAESRLTGKDLVER